MLKILQAGGLTMLPLALCSLVGLTVFLAKLWQLHSRPRWVSPREFDAALTQARTGGFRGVRTLFESARHPAAQAGLAALRMHGQRVDRVEAEAERVLNSTFRGLDSNIGGLALIAQVAPLLGLLGTALGMVELFVALDGAQAHQPAMHVLSAGIWRALLTTAAGLLVAVPALLAHSYLVRRVDDIRLDVVDILSRTLSALPQGEGS